MADFEWVKLQLVFPAAAQSWPIPDIDGIRLTTLEAEGDSEAHRRRLYELNAECSADIPDRGTFHTWEQYRALRLEVPSFDAGGIVLAIDGDDWVGMSGLSDHRERGYCFAEMTGVVRSHRRQGVAWAMKVANLRFATDCGVAGIGTVHHPRNTAMIELNRRLGFVDADWDYPR